MRIVIIGQQEFGQAVLEAFLDRGDEVAGVFTIPEKEGSKPDPLRLAAEKRNIPVFQQARLTDPQSEKILSALDADIGVMAYVLQFVPQSFAKIPRFGMIQYHPSLLPKYRGPSSINWPIVCGETETGLTIFRPTDGLDEGPIILQKKVSILPDDTSGSLYQNQLFPLGVNALLEAADLVVSGRHVEVAQDESLASYEGWLRTNEAKINWNMHVSLIYNLIRGCDPTPGAWTTVNGEKVQLLKVKKHAFASYRDITKEIGVITEIGKDSFRVTTHGGQIEVFSVRPFHAKRQSSIDYIQAKNLTVGTRLGE